MSGYDTTLNSAYGTNKDYYSYSKSSDATNIPSWDRFVAPQYNPYPKLFGLGSNYYGGPSDLAGIFGYNVARGPAQQLPGQAMLPKPAPVPAGP